MTPPDISCYTPQAENLLSPVAVSNVVQNPVSSSESPNYYETFGLPGTSSQIHDSTVYLASQSLDENDESNFATNRGPSRPYTSTFLALLEFSWSPFTGQIPTSHTAPLQAWHLSSDQLPVLPQQFLNRSQSFESTVHSGLNKANESLNMHVSGITSNFGSPHFNREAPEGQDLERRERSQDPEHPITSICTSNLAYLNYGRLKKAEILEMQALETRKKTLGEEHLRTMESMASLAMMYYKQGRCNLASTYSE